MLKNVMKRIVAITLCAVLLFSCAASAYAAEEGEFSEQRTSNPVFEAGSRVVACHPRLSSVSSLNYGSPMYYYAQDLLTEDSLDMEREFGEFAIFIDGKECKIDGDTFTLYPRIWYEFRTYFYNDSDEELTDVCYKMTAPNVVAWDSLEADHLIPNDKGELSIGVLVGDKFFEETDLPFSYAGGMVVDGDYLEHQSLALRTIKYATYGDCCARMMYYWSENDATVESVQKKELGSDSGKGASLGVIPPHTYGYVSSLVFLEYDALFRPRVSVLNDGAEEVIRTGYTARITM